MNEKQTSLFTPKNLFLCYLKAQTTVLLLSDVTSGLEIDTFAVPDFVDRRDFVELHCNFHLTPREELYSVKWYRTDYTGKMEEFYHHRPKANPPILEIALNSANCRL